MGDKMTAIQTMKSLNIPCVPGTGILDAKKPEDIKKQAKKIGYPVLIKASSGGGGRGMRVIHQEDELINGIHLTKLEAKNAFGDDAVYMEKYLNQPRHIEIQVAETTKVMPFTSLKEIAPFSAGTKKSLKNHQPSLPPTERQTIGEACVAACKAMGYTSLGTWGVFV